MKKKVKNTIHPALLILLLFISIPACSQVTVQKNLVIKSSLLNRDMKYSVLLPASYFISETSYPVIYLLHGFGGDRESWLVRCNIAAIVDSLVSRNEIAEFIFVMPDGINSYYINNFDNSIRYQDFFVEELLPAIDSLYRTKKEKEFRSLMGLSMGGFGSVILTIMYPDLFGNVVAMSPAVRNEEQFMGLPQQRYNHFFGPVFGYALEKENRITEHWRGHSPYHLVDSISAPSYTGVNWYIDCGLADSLLPSSKAFHELLLSYNIDHELHLRPGKHDWSFWYDSTISGLKYISGKIKNYE